MLTHLGVLTLKDDATTEDRAAIESGLRALVGVVPGLLRVSIGQDLGLKEGNAQLVFASVFESEQAWRDYGTHPAHLAVISEHIGPALASKAFVQFDSPSGASW